MATRNGNNGKPDEAQRSIATLRPWELDRYGNVRLRHVSAYLVNAPRLVKAPAGRPVLSKGIDGGRRAEGERARLLAGLRRGALDSLAALRGHSIQDVPRRVFELRAQGHKITMRLEWRATTDGKRHKVAVYTLEGEA
ncbi:helix-turn-helix domain-containing protein [Cupriavidus sp. 2MCAB6]|uniref:helix-turn-helix domain-containing protein n=1 Tax=Cupriavidus sp. 2MCAB6 TaxID=3232981 RepID=UPI003F93615E